MATLERSTSGGSAIDFQLGRNIGRQTLLSITANKIVFLTHNKHIAEIKGTGFKASNLSPGDFIDPSALTGNVTTYTLYYTSDLSNPLAEENWVRDYRWSGFRESWINFFTNLESGDLSQRIFKGNDTLIGSDSDNGDFTDELGNKISGDVMRGYDGNDSINGNGGNDLLSGDRGNDRLNGGSGDDILIGSEGNDQLNGNSGNNELFGGTGNDTYVVNFNAENGVLVKNQINDISGSRDLLNFNLEDSNLDSGSWIISRVNNGKDLLICSVNYEEIGREAFLESFDSSGRLDTDRLISETKYNLIVKNQFQIMNDKILPSLELIKFSSAQTFEMQNLSLKSNTLIGTNKPNFMVSDGENLSGLGGDDVLFADSILSQNLITLDGGSGNDFLAGCLSGSMLLGGPGNDEIVGRNGTDIIEGGGGKDKLEGGGGSDLFIYRSINDSGKTIVTSDVIGDNDDNGGLNNDFIVGEDKIDLSLLDGNTRVIGKQNFAFSGAIPAKNSVWISFDQALYKSPFNEVGSSILWVDSSGDAKADMCVTVVGIDLRSEPVVDWLIL